MRLGCYLNLRHDRGTHPARASPPSDLSPGNHNFIEEFVFESRLEEGIDPGVVSELRSLRLCSGIALVFDFEMSVKFLSRLLPYFEEVLKRFLDDFLSLRIQGLNGFHELLVHHFFDLSFPDSHFLMNGFSHFLARDLEGFKLLGHA